jgi:hypothetical protein
MEKTINLSPGQNLNEITLENVNNGIYVIRIRSENSTINQKIFVVK